MYTTSEELSSLISNSESAIYSGFFCYGDVWYLEVDVKTYNLSKYHFTTQSKDKINTHYTPDKVLDLLQETPEGSFLTHQNFSDEEIQYKRWCKTPKGWLMSEDKTIEKLKPVSGPKLCIRRLVYAETSDSRILITTEVFKDSVSFSDKTYLSSEETVKAVSNLTTEVLDKLDHLNLEDQPTKYYEIENEDDLPPWVTVQVKHIAYVVNQGKTHLMKGTWYAPDYLQLRHAFGLD